MESINGRNFIFPRFYRHAFLIAIDSFEMETVQRIFTAISEWHFSQGYSDKISMLAKVSLTIHNLFIEMHYENFLFPLFIVLKQNVAMTLCTVYAKMTNILLPTPKKFHYLFSLKDVSRIFQGISLVPPKKLTNAEKLIRLWAHETYRVYSDR